ncbi:MAG: glycosyltransferase family 4 protein [Nitrospirota bacterium]
MNILFVNNFRKRGGGEEFLRDLLPGLVRKGIKVGLVCRPGAPLVEMFKDSDVAVYPVDRSGVRALTSAFAIGAIIRREGYELVNIQRGHDIVQSWLGALLSGRRPRLMYTPQVPEFIRSRFLLRRMDAIATISRYIRDRLIAFDPSLASRISIVYYGIDLDRFDPASVKSGSLRRRFGLSRDTAIIGTVGDLWKNQIEFLDALVIIRRSVPDARFALVAEDTASPFVKAFKNRAAALGLTDAVLWTGRLSKEDMMSFYADIDVAVSTHRNEGFGIWALEAMAMGRPVIAYNAGGLRDAIEGPAGVLVDGGPEAMAAAAVQQLQDKILLASMSAAGPQWVRDRFPRQRMVDDYENYFTALIGRGTRAASA